MVRTHDRHRVRPLKTYLGEERDQVGSESVLRFVGVADLVVAQLECDRAPGAPPIVKLHLERLHHVRSRHGQWARCCLLDQSSGEACPTGRERVLELGAELGQWLDASGVEVSSEAGAASITQRHRAAPLDRSLGQHLADHDESHPDPAAQGETVVAFQVASPLLQGPHPRRSARVAHDWSPFRTRCHSVPVSRPSRRACLAASISRPVSIRPRHSRMASAIGCAASPW